MKRGYGRMRPHGSRFRLDMRQTTWISPIRSFIHSRCPSTYAFRRTPRTLALREVSPLHPRERGMRFTRLHFAVGLDERCHFTRLLEVPLNMISRASPI